MPTDPAYRTYVTTGRVTRHTDTPKTAKNIDDCVFLRVLLQPRHRWEDEFAVEFSFGHGHTYGGLYRTDDIGRIKIITVLHQNNAHANYPYHITGRGLAIKPNSNPPKRLTTIDTTDDQFNDLHLTFNEYTTTTIPSRPLTIGLSEDSLAGAELELTSPQRKDLEKFLNDCSVTLYAQRPESATLVGPDGTTKRVPTGRLHSPNFDPFDYLQDNQQSTQSFLAWY